MTIRSILVLLITVAGFGTGTYFYYQLYKYLRLGKDEYLFDQLGLRLKIFFRNVIFQKKMFKDIIPGLAHATIFWGFMVVTIGTIELILSGIIPAFNLSFLGNPLYHAILTIQDIFYLLVVCAVLFFFYRRLVIKPERLTVLSRHASIDAYFVLSLIAILMLSSLSMTGAQRLLSPEAHTALLPFASMVVGFFSVIGLSESTLSVVKESSWWIHFLTVLGFFCYLPFSKHLHVVAAAPNVFFSTLRHRGNLKKLDLEDESATQFGVDKIEDFSWKELLDAYACTECGRCNEFCPTYTTDKPLKPRSLIVDLRHHLEQKGKATIKKDKDHPSLAQSLIGDVTSEEAIWDCTTCGACVEACPVMIEHVDKIVDYRRNLVLMQGKMDPEAQKVFTNWENYSNPWGLSPDTRGDWAKDLGVSLYSENPDVEYLYYVGCAASFDARAQKIATAYVKLLKKAGISFGILGKEEKCNGESSRRMGNEYLGQLLIQSNKEVLAKYKVRKILTTCPHCFNTLKNEYPDFDAHYEVVHHTEFLMGLIKEGKLTISKDVKKKITYHDPCYLARYNRIFDAPRDILNTLPGAEIVEMDRIKTKGFCCGAGGGRMWLEETRGSRININRVEEAIATGADTIVSSCPFCVTMISDGLKAKNKENEIQYKDIAEILADSIA